MNCYLKYIKDSIEGIKMYDEILKIGEVIEIRGQKIRAQVYDNKNSAHLMFNGKIVKNVSVGSFVKITKGFNKIIGRIEGEYIVDKRYKDEEYKNKEDGLERVIEISVVGSLDSGNHFTHGLSELPLISNYVYVLQEEEVQSIFVFFKNKDYTVNVGKILGYEDYNLFLDVQKTFASHIGIFGNTGSGKSNTLAKIYTSLFDKYLEKFKGKSNFIIIDFNGEYESTICEDNKSYFRLSTSKKDQDKYPITKDYLLELEFWSIITEATEKTQKPFLKRVIRKYKDIVEKNEGDCKESIKQKIEALLNKIPDMPEKFTHCRGYFKELLVMGFEINDVESFFKKIGYHKSSNKLYIPSESKYFNAPEEFYSYPDFQCIIQKIQNGECKLFNNMNYLEIFNYVLKQQYLEEIIHGYSNEEHISPLMKRFETRLKDLVKVFEVKEMDIHSTCLNIVSLVDVNIYMRKIIPMILCKKIYDDHKKKNKDGSTLHIIVDEAHNILSQSSDRESSIWKDYRLEVFEEIIKEGRKFGVFLTIASQRPSDISPTIISQLHNYFLHRLVNNEDIRSISRTVAFLDNASFEMIPILPQGACVFTGTAVNFPVLVQIDCLQKDKQPQSFTVDLLKNWGVKNED